MELIRKNIHMERTKSYAIMQIAVEDDVNIPEGKPDVNGLHLKKAEFVIEEIKPGTGIVSFRGNLNYELLYYSADDECGLVPFQGKIPVEDRIYVQEVTAADNVQMEAVVEDLTVNLIHPGKINIRSMISVTACQFEIYDAELPTELRGEEDREYRHVELQPVQLMFCKNDIFRCKEEVTLPSNYPNIQQILWSTVTLGEVEFKASDRQLNLSGDIHLYVLYEGEGEGDTIRSYEKTLPFSGNLPCSGCREGGFPEVRYRLSQRELTIRPDFDGEERCIAIELVVDCNIRIYEEERIAMISDVYGVTGEIETQTETQQLKQLLAKATGKAKVTDRIRIKSGNVLQLLYSEGSICQKQQTVTENGVVLQGMIEIQLMYITGNDEAPYDSVQERIPFQYLLDIPGLGAEDSIHVHSELDLLQVVMLDSEEMDVKAVLSFSTVALKEIAASVIRQISVKPIDPEKLRALPGMVIYVVKPGDNLWNIGKKYYVPVDELRKQNHLDTETLIPGQKLIIVKHG